MVVSSNTSRVDSRFPANENSEPALIQTRHTHHKALLRLLQYVTTCREGQIRVQELSELAGFSRAHFSRLFVGALGETPADFERRLRLERSCYLMLDHGVNVMEASVYAEYANPEAFTRAFRKAYGLSPSQFRSQPSVDWRLPVSNGVHWLPFGVLLRYRPANHVWPAVHIEERPQKRLAVFRHNGGYLNGHVTWKGLDHLVPARLREEMGWKPIALYHDDPLRSANRDELRSDVGFELGPGQTPPDGMRFLEIPSGVYVVTDESVGDSGYGNTWYELNRQWLPRRGSRPKNLPAIDEFESWPVPWELRRARLLLGLDIELGYV